MPTKVAYQAKINYIQILNEQGKLDEKLSRGGLKDNDVIRLYEMMSLCRHYDEIAFKLQRSGRMGTYPQNKGQEAIGAVALAAQPDDWLVPCYRENTALFLHGLPMEHILLHWMGDERGNQIPDGVNVTPISIPIGTHMLHAAGIAWAQKLQGNDTAVFTFFGDGATSEGDFHEAMNFATVLKVPAVFICQNNKWAISTPGSKQSAAETFAQKGLAYGAHTIQIDGNDIFAVYKAAKDARAKALKDGKPTLIETLTYRLGDHTTADDARRYRDNAEVEEWLDRDPLIRTRKYLESKGLWDDAKQEAFDEDAKAKVSQIVKNAEGIAKPTTNDIFDYTYETLPEDLKRQRDTMKTHSLGINPQQETLRSPTGAASRV